MNEFHGMRPGYHDPKSSRSLKDRGEAHKLTANFFPHSITDPKWRFLNAYGGFINTALPHCDSAKILSFIKTMGGVPNHHIPPAWFSVPKGGIMILAGRHAFGGLEDAAVPKDILDARTRGAKLVVIDPIFTPEAAKADQWIPIKPSGDTAFFAGMIHHIITSELYNKAFVENWIREGDFEKLKACAADKTPKKMSAHLRCAGRYHNSSWRKNALRHLPWEWTVSRGLCSAMRLDFAHAWCIFLAITGNIDNPGGQPLPDLSSLVPCGAGAGWTRPA